MTDTPLDKLRQLPVPPPREAARKAALDAARAAFANSLPVAETAPKEPEALPRPMLATPQARRPQMPQLPKMQRKFLYAMAASVAVMAIGVPVAWQVGQRPPGHVASPTGPKSSEVHSPRKKPAEGTEASNVINVPTITVNRDGTVGSAPRVDAPSQKVPGLLIDGLGPTPAGSEDKMARIEPGQPRERATLVPPPAATAAPTAEAGLAAIAERKAELEATTARKGNRSSLGGEVDGSNAGQQQQARQDDGRFHALQDKAPEPARSGPPPPPAAYSDARKNLMSNIAERQQALIEEYKKKQHAAGGAGMTAAPAKPVATGRLEAIIYPNQLNQGRDRFPKAQPNPLKRVADEPVSTFSVDVDTASYSVVRRALNSGRLPPRDAVRVEEMINYFPYAYPLPESQTQPFLPTVTLVPSPWNAGRQLVHIAIKGYALNAAERPRANLVFLIDTSGSMGPEDRLPLVRNALRMLVSQLRPEDSIGIVTYAGNANALLPPTKLSERARILAAIEQLSAGGSTAGAAGLQQAYAMTEAGFDKSAVNRIVLATDGDFNVGITDRRELQSFIERKRDTGIYLSILGVGIGNHNDRLMQTLAQAGNGVAAYIDTLAEARKVLVEEASSTLFPIARDVKIQVEFNPATVSEYRLVGYETRMLKREDFNNDKVDAGDVGSGHAVTAIYEITPVGVAVAADPLRYGPASARPEERVAPPITRELSFLKLRYKLPKEEASRLIEIAIGPGLVKPNLASAPDDVRFAIAVAGFGELLKGSGHTGTNTLDDVIALASSARGDDGFGYRAEFVNLVRLAKSAAP